MQVLSRIKLSFFLNLEFCESFGICGTHAEFCTVQLQPPGSATAWPVGMILHRAAFYPDSFIFTKEVLVPGQNIWCGAYRAKMISQPADTEG